MSSTATDRLPAVQRQFLDALASNAADEGVPLTPDERDLCARFLLQEIDQREYLAHGLPHHLIQGIVDIIAGE